MVLKLVMSQPLVLLLHVIPEEADDGLRSRPHLRPIPFITAVRVHHALLKLQFSVSKISSR
jgi:hypothetical protein